MAENKTYQKVTIFVASPSDMETEKGLLTRVVSSLNKGLADYLGLVLELKDWKLVVPDMGRPEQVILDQLPVNEWDIFIGLMWLRFGSETGGKDMETGKPFESGTQEEFELAYRLWRETKKPRVLFYRCTRPPKSISDLDITQLGKVNNFFAHFDAVKGKHPGLYQAFESPVDFERIVNDHLVSIITEYGKHDPSSKITPSIVKNLVGSPNNLPRRAPFFGRNKEIDVAINALDVENRSWGLAIDGIGGIGKTALALEVAYICQEKKLFASATWCPYFFYHLDCLLIILRNRSIISPCVSQSGIHILVTEKSLHSKDRHACIE